MGAGPAKTVVRSVLDDRGRSLRAEAAGQKLGGDLIEFSTPIRTTMVSTVSAMPLLKGKVVRDENPVEGAYVRLQGPSGDFLSERRTSDSGTFRFHLKPGSWTLKWWLPGGEKGSKDVLLGDADTEDVISLP